MQIKHLFLVTYLICSPLSAYTIVINPAGDSHHPGRIIGNSFERGLNLQCAERIKILLEQTSPTLRVVITHFPNATVDTLQKATFVNRIADLYISIHCSEQTTSQSALSLYYFCNDPTLQQVGHSKKFSLVSLDHAHLQTTVVSQSIVSSLYTTVTAPHGTTTYHVYKPLGLPFLPLKGTTCPAFAVEMTVKNTADTLAWAHRLVGALQPILSELQVQGKNYE